MEEILEENKIEEEKLLKKVKNKKRVRGLLIVINCLLASYLIFEVGRKIYDVINAPTIQDEEIILLNGEDKNASLSLYDKYISKDNAGNYLTEDVYDYGIYGGYLHLSKEAIAPGCYSSFNSLAVVKVEENNVAFNSNWNKEIKGSYLDGGIDLLSLDVGDYIVIDSFITEYNYDQKFEAVKIRSNKGINKVVYSLPDSSSQRKKITIKSKDSSPCLVISVEKVSSIESTFYDYVFIGKEEDVIKYTSSFSAGIKVARFNTIEEAYAVDCCYAFVIDKDIEHNTVSHYIENTTCIKDDLYGGESIIANQDKNKYIRELGGYLTYSGSALKGDENTFITRPYLGDHDKGKYVFVIKDETTFDELINLI